MGKWSESGRLQVLSRLAAVSLIGGLGAACSSETMRFGADPFANPFRSGQPQGDPTMTGALAEGQRSAPNTAAAPVTMQPLPAAGPLSISPVAPATASVLSPAQPAPVTGGPAGWSTQGGARITVGEGESLATISTRYGVPAQAILSANGLSGGSQVTAGRQI